jgi:hypothetical protein
MRCRSQRPSAWLAAYLFCGFDDRFACRPSCLSQMFNITEFPNQDADQCQHPEGNEFERAPAQAPTL